MSITPLIRARLTSVFIVLLLSLQMACSAEEDLDNTPASAATDTDKTSTEISLSWTAPAERENHSPLSLSEIAGYRVYYGTVPGDYLNEVIIHDSNAETYTFTGLPKGTYYLVITTYDTEGRESMYSPELKIVI